MRNNLNRLDEELVEVAKAAHVTLKELSKDTDFRGYSQHPVISAFIIANQIKILTNAVNCIGEKLSDIAESIDCAGVKPVEYWTQSDIAAIDKATELGIDILPDYSMEDLRYKIYCTINEVL